MTRRRAQRGNAMVEFALAFGFLFAALAGAFEFGYSLQVYSTLQTAVRDAARNASMRVYDSASETPSAAYLSAVKNMAVYGDPAGGTRAVAPRLSTGNISVSVTFDRRVPYQVTVAVVNYRIDAVFATLTFSGKPKVTFPYLGRYAPPA